jgi:putative spermidine/putrescine transport system permease protein
MKPPQRTAVWLLAPAIVLLGGLFVGGLFFAALQSLGFFDLLGGPAPTLAHYATLFSDRAVQASFGLTIAVAVVSTLLATLAGLGVALLLRGLPHAWLSRSLVQLPLPTPHLVAAIGFGLLLAQSGIVARWFYVLGLVSQPSDMPALTNDRLMVSVILTYVWKETPFIALTTLAALRSAGEQLELTARNLGATRWQAFWHVTLPLIAPALLGSATIAGVYTLGAYEVPLLLGQSFPRTLAVEAVARYQDTDLATRPAALALNTLLTGLTLLAVPPYLWLLRRTAEAR